MDFNLNLQLNAHMVSSFPNCNSWLWITQILPLFVNCCNHCTICLQTPWAAACATMCHVCIHLWVCDSPDFSNEPLSFCGNGFKMTRTTTICQLVPIGNNKHAFKWWGNFNNASSIKQQIKVQKCCTRIMDWKVSLWFHQFVSRSVTEKWNGCPCCCCCNEGLWMVCSFWCS